MGENAIELETSREMGENAIELSDRRFISRPI